MDLASNNLKTLICHKTQTNKHYIYKNGFGINNLQWLMFHENKLNHTDLVAKERILFEIAPT